MPCAQNSYIALFPIRAITSSQHQKRRPQLHHQDSMSTVVAAPRDLGLETVPFPKAHVTGAQQNSSNGSTYKHSDEDERIIDIRRGAIEHSVLEDMMSRLQPGEGKAKQMPTLLLYDELGLKLFEDITYLDEYYLTNAEIDILQRHAADIASRLQPDSMIIELGSGYGLASQLTITRWPKRLC